MSRPSYPYLKVARQHDVDYGLALHFVSLAERARCLGRSTSDIISFSLSYELARNVWETRAVSELRHDVKKDLMAALKNELYARAYNAG